MIKSSSYYETSPVDYHDQPDFVNSVIEVESSLDPHSFLGRIKAIEQSVNPLRKITKGPRMIDLDILLYNDQVIESEELVVPHPALCRRKFVLVPLLEIAPDQQCPVDRRPYRQCLQALNDPSQKVELCHG